jgi:hypothetical protein
MHLAAAALLAIAIPVAVAAQTPAAPPQRPCESDANYRKFDFWIGDWDVQRTGVPRAHQSKDGGKTWTVTFDLTYVRK